MNLNVTQFRTFLIRKMRKKNNFLVKLFSKLQGSFPVPVFYTFERCVLEVLPGLLAWVRRGWWVWEQAGCTSSAEEPSLVPHPSDPSGEGPGDRPHTHKETLFLKEMCVACCLECPNIKQRCHLMWGCSVCVVIAQLLPHKIVAQYLLKWQSYGNCCVGQGWSDELWLESGWLQKLFSCKFRVSLNSFK